MKDKNFNCKMEDLPVIAGFVIQSMETDKVDFIEYSPVYDGDFIPDAKAKQKECSELVKQEDVLKRQKKVTQEITNNLNGLRKNVNTVEGYLNLAANKLDIGVADFNLSVIRSNISKKSVEGVCSEMQALLVKLRRNEAELSAKGMKSAVLDDLAVLAERLDSLNLSQNDFKNKRSRTASDNVKIFNELWDILDMILDGGRSLYRVTDKVKYREYTLSHLKKRVHLEKAATQNNNDAEAPAAEPENLV